MPGLVQAKLVHPNHFEEVRRCVELHWANDYQGLNITLLSDPTMDCSFQVRSVQCRGDRVYTGCYDGIVREFDLTTGRLLRVVADHAPYAVEGAQIGASPNGRLVSVDWSGVVACVPATEPWHARRESGAEDVETLVYGREAGGGRSEDWAAASLGGRNGRNGSNNSSGRGTGVDMGRPGTTYRLCPIRAPSSGRLQYRRLGPREEPPEVAEAHMSSSVGCLVHDEDRLLLGSMDGRIISLLFRGGL